MTGENFKAPAVVLFGDRLAVDPRVLDPNTIEVKTPAHAAGQVDVRVETDNKVVGVLQDGYTYR